MANGNSRIVSKYIKVWRTQHTRPKDIHFLSDNMNLPGLLRPTIRNTFVGSSALSNDIQIQFQSHPMISFSSFKTPSFAKPTRRVTVKRLLTLEYSNDNIPPLRLTEKNGWKLSRVEKSRNHSRWWDLWCSRRFLRSGNIQYIEHIPMLRPFPELIPRDALPKEVDINYQVCCDRRRRQGIINLFQWCYTEQKNA